jgi:SAM-dependent methyltransferase
MTSLPAHACRFCGTPLRDSLCDLGMSPMSNSYIAPEDAQKKEPFYPLHAYVCAKCFLVQLPEFESPEHIFSDYAYFSSYSESWLAHAKAYTEAMTARFALGPASRVIEIASNDGYLLQYFAEKAIPVLGIEPAANVAAVAIAKGIASRVQFFGVSTARELAAEGLQADLLLGNNVLAHVPDINDFVAGMKIALKPAGVITMEFPHLLQLMQHNQFDTIYHEHFSYLSFTTVEKVFAAHGLALFDVEELPTHGGSLRIYAAHAGDASKATGARVAALKAREDSAGLADLSTYAAFAEQVRETKRALLEFLIAAKRSGKRVAGYGAPAKGNTLLNYCGIREDFLDYTVDRSPHKQGRFLPGTRIPIHAPEKLRETRPDYVLILPWNLKDEITAQMAHIREWGGRFVVPIPRVEVLD